MFAKKWAAVAALAFASTSSFAQANDGKGMYGEIGYTSSKFVVQGVSGSWTPSALRGIVGVGLGENVAVEAMALIGVSDSNNLGITVKLTSGAGFYVKPRVKLGDSVELFARLGWANINGKVNATDTRDNGASYGAGASFGISKSTSVNVDYMLFNDANGSKIDGVSVGLGFKF